MYKYIYTSKCWSLLANAHVCILTHIHSCIPPTPFPRVHPFPHVQVHGSSPRISQHLGEPDVKGVTREDG